MISVRSQMLTAPLGSTPRRATRSCYGDVPALPGLGCAQPVTGSPWEAETKGEHLVTLGLGGTARCCSRSRREGEEAALCQQPRWWQAFVGWRGASGGAAVLTQWGSSFVGSITRLMNIPVLPHFVLSSPSPAAAAGEGCPCRHLVCSCSAKPA